MATENSLRNTAAEVDFNDVNGGRKQMILVSDKIYKFKRLSEFRIL